MGPVEQPEWLTIGISNPPRILSKFAGKESCTIFKVPASLIEGNHCYFPRIVSVGPFHHRQGHLQMMEEHKYHYLRQLLARARLRLDDLFGVLKPLEASARECYSEDIPEYFPNHFLSVMLVDGCFIVELLRKVNGLVPFEDDDPINSMSWIRSFLLRDLILLENQIPFFIIQKLFDHTRADSETNGETGPVSLLGLCHQFLSSAVGMECWAGRDPPEGTVEHLLDLLRTSFLPAEARTGISPGGAAAFGWSCSLPPSSQVVPSLLKLRRSGIELSQRKRKGCSDKELEAKMSFLDVKFIRCGVMEIPKLTVDQFMALFLSNCLAYESCHKTCSKHFTAYIVLLDCLVKSEDEIHYLCNNDIIENYIGTDAELASFINNLGKNVSLDVDQCYLTNLFREIKSYQRSWNVRWRSCKYPLSLMLRSFTYTYFNTPWSFISAVVVFVLLILSSLQTLFTIYTYYQ